MINQETIYTKRAKYGPMHTFGIDNCVGESVRRYGEWADAEIALLLSFVDGKSVFVDIGANIGTHTVALAKKAHFVLAFEPQLRVFQVLCANVVANQLPNVMTRNAAIGGTCGTTKITALDFNAHGNNLGAAKIETDDGVGIPASMVTLDSVGLAHCDAIKADIEGHELHMLHGAERTVNDCRPIVYLEHHTDRDAVQAWLRERNYRLFCHPAPAFNPENYARDKVDIFHGYIETNLLAWPAEKPLAPSIDEAWSI